MTPKPLTCYCVFGAAANPIWYTCRPSAGLAKHVYEVATGTEWLKVSRRGYTVRRLRMTEVK